MTQTHLEEPNGCAERNSLRSVEQCLTVVETHKNGMDELSDEEIIRLVRSKQIIAHKLESEVEMARAVLIRRKLMSEDMQNHSAMTDLPYLHYDYKFVYNACCENVIGYVPVPVGVAGPLLMDGEQYYVPMATTEGCLVASVNRGCRAITLSGGCSTIIHKNAMSRGPAIKLPSIRRCFEVKQWLETPKGFEEMRRVFESTSSFAQLTSITSAMAGRSLYLRFCATTGDAMGMNMISKGTEKALYHLQTFFTDIEIVTLSGNYCTDKKPAAMNWLLGRGKSVVGEAIITEDVIRNVLKTTAEKLVALNTDKNLIGSAIAASIGGFNAHAVNTVTAIYIATGQDVAQNVEGSNCMTLMECVGLTGTDLLVTCTMPCIEVGTVGGGTHLPAQSACLKLMGVHGPNASRPGANAETLARIICGAVIGGELSLLAAQAEGHLVQSHLKHNRSKMNLVNMNGHNGHR